MRTWAQPHPCAGQAASWRRTATNPRADRQPNGERGQWLSARQRHRAAHQGCALPPAPPALVRAPKSRGRTAYLQAWPIGMLALAFGSPMHFPHYFLRLWNTPSSRQMHALQEKDGTYLSPHGRVAGWKNAAAIKSAEAARLISELWMPTLQKRMGPGIRIELEPSMLDERRLAEPSVRHGAATLLARAREQLFHSNQLPDAAAISAAHLELSTLSTGVESSTANTAP